MATVVWIILCAKLCSAVVLEDYTSKKYERQARLRLPTEYHFKGDVTCMEDEIIKPFEIWYSERHNRSRQDTYGGMVSRYYYGDRHRIYTIHPASTNELVSRTMCTATNMTDKRPTNIFLPPTKLFEYSGYRLYNNKLVDVWSAEVLNDDYRLTKELLVLNGEKYDIPILWKQTVYSLQRSTVESRFLTRYYDYQELNIDDVQELNIDEKAEKDCVWHNIAGATSSLQADVPSDVVEAFRRYKNHHNKIYFDDEEELRAMIFKSNWRLVTEHNSRNVSYKLALNKFSDRLPSELAHLTATKPGDPHAPASHNFPFSDQQLQKMILRLPKNFDMRTNGTISAVKSQADCGSCYAFTTVATVEGALARRNATRNLDLSEQSLVDCSWSFGNHGCTSGSLISSFQYVKKHGIPTEMDYGMYLAENGVCKYKNVTEVTRIKGFARVTGGVAGMKAAVYHFGPVAATMHMMDELKFYEHGIFYHPDCNKDVANHGVTVVGYGDSNGSPYWIIKNSWGEDWGQAGYLLLSAVDNNCHLLNQAFYVTV